MTPKEYILSQLERLGERSDATVGAEKLSDFIYEKLMSKKFRKFAIPDINKETIRKEVQQRVENSEPILIHYPFGGYKLWRLEESPEVDWAELFAIIYIVRWLKPICDVYKPGVHFVFRFDEVIVERLNNIPTKDTETYRESFENLLKYIKQFTPENIEFEVFLERSRYKDYAEFEKELAVEIEALRKERGKNHILTDKEKAMIDLNVRLKLGQDDNPNWREENDLIHIAYYNLKAHKKHPRPNHRVEGIVAFPLLTRISNIIAIGSTKTSVAKFWISIGVLQKRGDSYIEVILSPSQIKKSTLKKEEIDIEDLVGKNFKYIKIIV